MEWNVASPTDRDTQIGASNREIAAVIYGHDWVEQDWPNAGLQDPLRRDLQRGLALSSGGYRDLLA
jgi:hypothetical protein